MTGVYSFLSVDINLIRNEECHIWQTAEKILKEALKENGLLQEYKVIVVKNNEEAQKYRFFGSPQITIDGVDIDPMAAKATQFQAEGCRFYMWEAEGPKGSRRSKRYEYPPKEMILQGLNGSN